MDTGVVGCPSISTIHDGSGSTFRMVTAASAPGHILSPPVSAFEIAEDSAARGDDVACTWTGTNIGAFTSPLDKVTAVDAEAAPGATLTFAHRRLASLTHNCLTT